jgi:hypothetical protein
MAPLRYGVALHLEAEADRLIKESLKGVTRYSDKDDILTPWKERMRHEREVYNHTGVAEATQRRGSFHKPLNSKYPHLNSTDGAARIKGRPDSLADHVESSQSSPTMDDFWR